MPQDREGERVVVGGLLIALILLVINLIITLWFYWSDGSRPTGAEDIAGTAVISAAMLAIIGVLGAYLSREQKQPD